MNAIQKKTYDLVLPLGEACSCSATLREAGLQHLSFPFDWIAYADPDGERAKHDALYRARDIASRFHGWFHPEDFTPVSATQGNGKDVYINRALDLVFNHDFPSGMEFSRAFELVSARYRKRCARLLQLLDAARRVLIVRMERPYDKILKPVPTLPDDSRELRRVLQSAFPNATFDVFVFRFERGRAEKDLVEEEIEPGLTQVTFDYHDYNPGLMEYAVRLKCTAAILSSRFAVVDYRTPEEIHAYRQRLRRKALDRLLKPFKRLFRARSVSGRP